MAPKPDAKAKLIKEINKLEEKDEIQIEAKGESARIAVGDRWEI